ncbi:MAG TPA: DUF4303 domain-containing protein [Tepidisphaeraceae bacterium]|jgi:hypothetical protein|nr:DUF4303 domain-containing protein [Tepidisphaeraceae bacterium]
MAEPELFRRIREELKRTVRSLLDQLGRDHPNDRVYAVLFEVDVSRTYAIRIAGSEESLTRLAEKYAAKGYRAERGDSLKSLRALLRWDAPGDDKHGWYWGDQQDDAEVTRLINQAVEAGLIQEYGAGQPLETLCIAALRELDSEGAFGSGHERERVLIGTCCCEVGFGEAQDVEELATLNPPATIRRLRRELRAAKAADRTLTRPR